jgi:hypothetical protein
MRTTLQYGSCLEHSRSSRGHQKRSGWSTPRALHLDSEMWEFDATPPQMKRCLSFARGRRCRWRSRSSSGCRGRCSGAVTRRLALGLRRITAFAAAFTRSAGRRLRITIAVGEPATTLERDRRRRENALQRAAALGADGDLGVRELLDLLGALMAGGAFVFVERHGASFSLLRGGVFSLAPRHEITARQCTPSRDRDGVAETLQ